MGRESSELNNQFQSASQEFLFRLFAIEEKFLEMGKELRDVKKENEKLKEENLKTVLEIQKGNYNAFVADVASVFSENQGRKDQLELMIKKVTRLIDELKKG